MPLLQVRDIPEDLYDEISRVARLDNRSIAQETIVLLKSALNYTDTRIKRRLAVLKEIKSMDIDSSDELPDPVDLIREDRDR
ncbi:MAG: hypothetical protein DRP70_13105 [Spirochaetes bacterium]|nr:MAG: hypothetical protein DRP70_13105 [Spirochaetota bacterium]